MEDWVAELIKRRNRRQEEILFGEHAADNKNLTEVDIEAVLTTVRYGKTDSNKSNREKERVCFKNYFNTYGITYFVIIEYYPTFIKIITVIKKKGKY